MNDDINYSGISEATLIHSLYHGTVPLGYGHLHHKGDLSLDDVAADLDEMAKGEYPQPDHRGLIRFDYYRGHPLKLTLDTVNKTFNPRLYDRDAGRGAAERIVAQLKD
jgi:hypothetical protein